jgi:hypothetical protein
MYAVQANAEVLQLRYDMKATQSQLTAALSQLQQLDAATAATAAAPNERYARRSLSML